MKKVDYEHFSRFRYPLSLKAYQDKLYCIIKSADMEGNKYSSDIFAIENGHVRKLTSTGDVSNFYPTEKGIIFPSLRRDADKETAKSGIPLTVLQCLPYDGGEACEFLRLDYSVGGIEFITPTHFFFTANYSHAFAKAMNESENDPKKAAALVKEDEDYDVLDEIPFWSNGAGMTYKNRDRLYIYKEGTVTAVTDEWTNTGALRLSADRSKLYFMASRYESKMTLEDKLMELDIATGKVRDISVSEKHMHADVIPMDKGIMIFAGTAEKHGANTNANVYFRSDEGDVRLLYDGGMHCFYNSVGSDINMARGIASPLALGGKAYVTDTQYEGCQLMSIDAQSGAIENFTNIDGAVNEAVFHGDGFAVIAQIGRAGGEIYQIDYAGKPTLISDINTSLSDYEYSEPKPLSFVNAEGTEIHGFVINPMDFDPSRKYPAILDVHGGPKTVYGTAYFHEMQLWAQRGYVVMFCNPTGGDGRGDEFADLCGGYGKTDFDDLMSFTDLVLEHCPYIDDKRVGVTGGSYGGFMTNWIIGHTNRFAAAASQRSISNWLSFYGLSDIGYFFASDQQASDPWSDPKKMWDHSPLKYADMATTPTLFIHSEKDYRCNMEEGLQMFTALVNHGVPTRLCLFHGETHELSRSGKPKHRVRRLKEITEWFDKYLKAEN